MFLKFQRIKMHRNIADKIFWQIGIEGLLNKNVYSAAYPLHDGRYDEDGPEGTKSTRRVKNWISL